MPDPEEGDGAIQVVHAGADVTNLARADAVERIARKSLKSWAEMRAEDREDLIFRVQLEMERLAKCVEQWLPSSMKTANPPERIDIVLSVYPRHARTHEHTYESDSISPRMHGEGVDSLSRLAELASDTPE